MKILPEGSIEILERIEDPVTDLLEKTPLDHSDVAFPRALVPGLVGPGRQHRKAHVIGKVTVGGIYIGVVQISPVDSAFEIVHHHIGGNPAKVGEHAALDPDKRGKLLIEHELAEEIRAKRQHPQEKLRKGLMATDRIGEKKTVTEIDLGFFRRLVIQPFFPSKNLFYDAVNSTFLGLLCPCYIMPSRTRCELKKVGWSSILVAALVLALGAMAQAQQAAVGGLPSRS